MMHKNLLYIIFLFISITHHHTIPKESSLLGTGKHFVLFVAGRNNVKWYKKNLDSIFEQTYTNYDLIYVDDASTDCTGDLVKQYFLDNQFYLASSYKDECGNLIEKYAEKNDNNRKIILIINEYRKYKMANQYGSIHTYCKNSDIVVEIDADDWFVHDRVLSYLNKIYANPNIWLTYGLYIEYPTGKIGCDRSGRVPQKIIAHNKFRKYKWRYTGLYTYYAGLFKLVSIEDCLYKGSDPEFSYDFTPISSDNVIYPMLEMCSNGHFKYINDILYVLNRDNMGPSTYPHRMKKIREERQKMIRNEPPYAPLKRPLWSIN